MSDPRPIFQYRATDHKTGEAIRIQARRPPARAPDRDAIAAYAHRQLYRSEMPPTYTTRRQGRAWTYHTIRHSFTLRHEETYTP